MFQQATATCHKNKIIVYFESHSSLYTHGNEASVHPSTEATIHNTDQVPYLLIPITLATHFARLLIHFASFFSVLSLYNLTSRHFNL